MKKLITLMLILFIGLGSTVTISAQESQLSRREQRAQRREQRREQAAIAARVRHQVALQALNERQFVLEADKVTSRRGQFVYVTSFTNFIMVNGDRGTVQLAFNTTRPTPNLIGGITVDGIITNPRLTTNNRGRVTYTFGIQGAAVSARITIQMDDRGNVASADVSPNFNNRRFTMSGEIIPLSQSNVFRGRSL